LNAPYLLEKKIISLENPSGIVLVIESGMDRSINLGRRRINNRTLNALGYIVFWTGILLTVGGLCILLVNLIRH
jgi:hypothetical protein